MNYYIADLHLGHANAIRFDNRPFADVADMNETLVQNWNSVVTVEDTVYILGDFIWEKESCWPDWLDQLAGNKVLIRGNHDPREFSQTTKRYFQEITDYKEITDTGRHVIMSHYPMPFHRADYDEKCVMFYGHVHNSREYAMLEEIRRHIVETCTERHHAKGNFINVGCMMPWMAYQPRTVKQILKDICMLESYEESGIFRTSNPTLIEDNSPQGVCGEGLQFPMRILTRRRQNNAEKRNLYKFNSCAPKAGRTDGADEPDL